MNGSLIAAADEHGCQSRAAWYRKKGHGINAGVMLIDIASARIFGLQDLFLAALEENPRFADQDAINTVLNNSPFFWLHELPCEFNFRPENCYFDVDDCERCANSPIILHSTRMAYIPRLAEGTIYTPPFGRVFRSFALLTDALTVLSNDPQKIAPSYPEVTARIMETLVSSDPGPLNAHVCVRRTKDILAKAQLTLSIFLDNKTVWKTSY